VAAIASAAGLARVALPVGAGEPGADQYGMHCLACHGAGLEGVEGLGLNLTTSPFVASTSVAGLVAFLKAGRLPDAADSVSGRPMPGFFWLAEDDLQQIASWVKARRGG
jgi:mono/diheme cytochrome c family protein